MFVNPFLVRRLREAGLPQAWRTVSSAKAAGVPLPVACAVRCMEVTVVWWWLAECMDAWPGQLRAALIAYGVADTDVVIDRAKHFKRVIG